jgi:hypothetical protein
MIRNLHSGDSFDRIHLEHGVYEIQTTFGNSGFYFGVEGIFTFFYKFEKFFTGFCLEREVTVQDTI